MRTLSRGLAILLSSALASAQTTWYVDANAPGPGDGSPGNPYQSIQYAIEQPSTVSGDTLLCLPGTYEETVDYSGKSLALRSSGGSSVTTILVPSPSQHERCVLVQNGEGAGTLLEGFTLTGQGYVANPDRGVGLRVVGATLELRDVHVVDVGDPNSTMASVGLYAEAASLVATDCSFRDVQGASFKYGSGMGLVDSVADFHDCILADNYGWIGVGAYIDGGLVTFEGCTFENNRSQNDVGGGIACTSAHVTLRDCDFRANRTLEGYPGGAVHASGGGTLAVEGCRFEQNNADRGGAIFLDGVPATVRGSSFVGNVATMDTGYGIGDGGALYGDPFLALERCTFVGNRALGDFVGAAGRGGAVYSGSDAVHCTFLDNSAVLEGGALYSAGTVSNSILWGSSPDAAAGGTTITWSDVEGGFAGTGNLNADPLFVDEAGGDVRLQAGSPCIDAGDPSSPPDGDGTRADMGALPYGPAIENYCEAKTNSQGCVPSAVSFGTPTLATGADDFVLAAVDAINRQFALPIWGYAEADQPLFGGTLCVAAPFVRGTLVKTGGTSTGTDCTGAPRFPFTRAYMTAHGVQAYDTLFAQWWSRDPGFPPPANVSLSDGLRFTVLP